MGPDNRVNQIAQRVVRKLAQAEEKRQDRELVRAMQGLGLGDREDDRNNDAMDVDIVRVVEDLNEYFANLLRSKKN